MGKDSCCPKERLWSAFRRAILKVGMRPLLRTSGTHYMADEYVRQAGVPLVDATGCGVTLWDVFDKRHRLAYE